VTLTVLDATREIALPSARGDRPIQTRVVEEREVLNGELVEIALLYYARCLDTGDIYFFGEQADIYEDGVIVSDVGSWKAGLDGAKPGIIMPGTFLLGSRYLQQLAPAVVMDHAENFEAGIVVETVGGTFNNCIRIREFDGFKPEIDPSIKTYAPGVGMIEDDELQLQSFRLATQGIPQAGTFVPFSNNPFLPLSPGMEIELSGVVNGRTMTRSLSVLDEVRAVTNNPASPSRWINTRVVEQRTTENGSLLETAREFLAQCLETGDVWIFGRELEHYVDGDIVSTEGSWVAGTSEAQAGLVMPSQVAVGAQYPLGDAAGIYAGRATITATGLITVLPAGSFSDCITVAETDEANPQPASILKTYAPGIGLVKVDEALQLSSFSFDPSASTPPTLIIQDTITLSWPAVDAGFTAESSPDLTDWSVVRENPVWMDGRNQLTLPRDHARKYFRLSRSGDD
jgi:hypothetical protein